MLDPNDGDATSAVEDLTDGLGADITVETVGGFGNNATLVQAVDMTRVMGRIVVLGVFHDPVHDRLDGASSQRALDHLLGSATASWTAGTTSRWPSTSWRSGKVDLKPMVTHTYPLTEMPQALATAYDKSTGSIKVQLRM